MIPRVRGEAEQLHRARVKIRELKAAVRALTWGEWDMRLHEEGCVGTRERPDERSGEQECRCDGDYLTTLVKKAMR